MNKLQSFSSKEDIEQMLKENGINNPEIILVPEGCLAQAIDKDPKATSQKLLKILTTNNQSADSNISTFPFRIYVYSTPQEAFKEVASLMVNLHSNESGHNTTYSTREDAVISMREIDVDALLYRVSRPFEFEVKSLNTTFPMRNSINYRELVSRGHYYRLDNSKATITKLNDNSWKIRLELVSNSHN